jgi:perosamine synthetase
LIAELLSRSKDKVREPILNFLFQALIRPDHTSNQRTPFDWQELKLLRQALVSQNLCCIGGQMVTALEKEFAEMYGVPYGVASTSGTAAIHVALGALNLNPGDEVITAPITDLGTIIPILYQNAIPVFADIDDTYNIDPADVVRKITPRTRAIIAVHLFGNPCNMDAMVEIAKRHNIALIEDCAQAHLAQYKGKYAGTIGDIGCFSFQQSKHMTTGDGGLTITSNKSYYERMKLFADKGYARKGWGARAYLFHAPNYRMTELVGAVGLAQLKKVRSVVERRREAGLYLTELLSGLDEVQTAPTTPGATHSYWLYPLTLRNVDSQVFAAEMKKARVHVLIGYTGKPIYLCSESLTAKKTYGDSEFPFSCNAGQTYEYKEGLCPRAEAMLPKLICLPLDEKWNRREVERVAGVISSIVKNSGHKQSAVRVDRPAVNAAVAQRESPLRESTQRQTAAIGIIGCGQMGQWHLNAYKNNPSCRVAAVADTNFTRAQTVAAEIGARAYTSHTEMIQNEALDGVSVCTVPSTHQEIVIDCLKAGVHVLCEKPLAVSVDEAAEMLKVAQQQNRLVLPAFKFRFFDEVLRTKEMIERGSFGKILNFRLMFGGYMDMAGSWYVQKELSGGGIIMDNGPHASDLIRYLLGEIRTVTAHASQIQDLDVEDTAQLMVQMESGTTGTIDLSWSSSVPAKTYLEIYGEDGAALLDHEGVTYRFKSWKDWKRTPNEASAPAAFARQIDHFLECISGKSVSRVSENDGLMSQVVIEAAYESVRRNAAVNVITRDMVFAVATTNA